MPKLLRQGNLINQHLANRGITVIKAAEQQDNDDDDNYSATTKSISAAAKSTKPSHKYPSYY